MKHVTATVLTLCLLATGSAVAAPNDRGPQHDGRGQPPHAMAHGPAQHAGKPVPPPPSHHQPAPPPKVVEVRHGPRHAPPPPRHVAYQLRRGDRLPPHLRGYQVHDWKRAGLHRPPRGHEWRRIDGRDVLIAVATGVITDIILRSY